jgi:hypothetical protein
MAQSAVCNRHHSIAEQLCRLLLLSFDRVQGDELLMTQELISNMLGVRREGITEAAHNLQNAGSIQYSRGHIKLLNRAILEQRSCECYAVVRNELDRLLPPDFNDRHFKNRLSIEPRPLRPPPKDVLDRSPNTLLYT